MNKAQVFNLIHTVLKFIGGGLSALGYGTNQYWLLASGLVTTGLATCSSHLNLATLPPTVGTASTSCSGGAAAATPSPVLTPVVGPGNAPPSGASGFVRANLLAGTAIVSLAIFLGIILLPGCESVASRSLPAAEGVTTGGIEPVSSVNGTISGQTPAELAANLETVVSLAAAVALAEKPNLRPDLQAAYEALTVAMANGHTSSAQLIADLNQSLAPADQKAVDAVFAVALADYDARLKADAATLTSDQTTAEALVLLRGIQAGLKTALST
jgi:hypothetical protein